MCGYEGGGWMVFHPFPFFFLLSPLVLMILCVQVSDKCIQRRPEEEAERVWWCYWVVGGEDSEVEWERWRGEVRDFKRTLDVLRWDVWGKCACSVVLYCIVLYDTPASRWLLFGLEEEICPCLLLLRGTVVMMLLLWRQRSEECPPELLYFHSLPSRQQEEKSQD